MFWLELYGLPRAELASSRLPAETALNPATPLAQVSQWGRHLVHPSWWSGWELPGGVSRLLKSYKTPRRMTSIAIWAGVDQRGPSSLHIASDSRLSWGSTATWDHGRKTFASTRTPDIFGYCGDVVYASILLSQFVSALDLGGYSNSGERFAALSQLAKTTWAVYPKNLLENQFSLVHGMRDGHGMKASFVVNVLKWSDRHGWSEESFSAPTQSSQLILNMGSGRAAVDSAMSEWAKSTAGGTSRAVYSSFVQAVRSGQDPGSGGSTQLVSLLRIGNGRTNGIVFEGRRYMSGLPVSGESFDDDVKWYNEYFERCDGTTMMRIDGAQIHEKHPRRGINPVTSN